MRKKRNDYECKPAPAKTSVTETKNQIKESCK